MTIISVWTTVVLFNWFGPHSFDNSDFRIVRTEFTESVWNQGHANASIVSQDGGSSYNVPGGSLWWFGDTFRGSRNEQGEPQFADGAVSCAVAMLGRKESEGALPPQLKFLRNEDGLVDQAIEFLPGESWEHHRIWPFAGLHLNGKSYVFYSLIELTGKKSWGFKSAGSGLAVAAHPLGRHARIQKAGGWQFPVKPSAIVESGQWIYCYDVEKRGEQQGVWLSRVRATEIEEPDAYQFYSGPGPDFASDKSKQIPLLTNLYGQVSIVWNAYLDRYVLASSSNLYRPHEIRFHTAENPCGPWSKVVASISVPTEMQGKRVDLVYCSFFHPELFRDNGRIINLTWSVHLEKTGFDANNGMVEIELSRDE